MAKVYVYRENDVMFGQTRVGYHTTAERWLLASFATAKDAVDFASDEANTQAFLGHGCTSVNPWGWPGTHAGSNIVERLATGETFQIGYERKFILSRTPLPTGQGEEYDRENLDYQKAVLHGE